MSARLGPGLAAVLIAAVLALGTSAQSPARIVITGARVLDVTTGQYRDAGAVVVEGERIAAVGAAPYDSSGPLTRIDATGRTIVPGLMDLAVAALPSVELDVDYFYALSLAHGVTGLRVVDAVLPWSVTQRDRVRSGAVVAPRLWTSGPALVSRQATGALAGLMSRAPMPAFVPVDARSVGRETGRQVEARVDWVRLGADLPPDVMRTAVASVAKRSVAVSAAPGATSMLQLVALGVDAIDGLAAPLKGLEEAAATEPEPAVGHQGRDRPTRSGGRPPGATASSPPAAPPDGAALLDAAWISSSVGDLTGLARRIAQARVCVIPMLRVASERVASERKTVVDAERALLPDGVRSARRDAPGRIPAGATAPGPNASRALDARRRLVAAVNQAGGSIGVASGARQDGWPVPGLAVHHELALLVAAGLTPAEAIRAATTGASATLRATKTVGQVRAGFAADFFIVEGDPLADIGALRNITHVVRAGEVLDPQALLARARRAGGRGK